MLQKRATCLTWDDIINRGKHFINVFGDQQLNNLVWDKFE